MPLLTEPRDVLGPFQGDHQGGNKQAFHGETGAPSHRAWCPQPPPPGLGASCGAPSQNPLTACQGWGLRCEGAEGGSRSWQARGGGRHPFHSLVHTFVHSPSRRCHPSAQGSQGISADQGLSRAKAQSLPDLGGRFLGQDWDGPDARVLPSWWPVAHLRPM